MLDKLDTLPDKNADIKAKFLQELGDEKVAGNVLIACRRVGVARATAYFWKANDAEFSKKWTETVTEAQDTFVDEAEFALRNQVLKGNTSAIMFVLKKLKPEKWGDKQPDLPPSQDTHTMSKRFYENVYLPIMKQSTIASHKVS